VPCNRVERGKTPIASPGFGRLSAKARATKAAKRPRTVGTSARSDQSLNKKENLEPVAATAATGITVISRTCLVDRERSPLEVLAIHRFNRFFSTGIHFHEAKTSRTPGFAIHDN